MDLSSRSHQTPPSVVGFSSSDSDETSGGTTTAKFVVRTAVPKPVLVRRSLRSTGTTTTTTTSCTNTMTSSPLSKGVSLSLSSPSTLNMSTIVTTNSSSSMISNSSRRRRKKKNVRRKKDSYHNLQRILATFTSSIQEQVPRKTIKLALVGAILFCVLYVVGRVFFFSFSSLSLQYSIVTTFKNLQWSILMYFFRPRYISQMEMNARSTRFPSVEQRVKVYMSNWYLPPCTDTGKIVIRRRRQQPKDSKNLTILNSWIVTELDDYDNQKQEENQDNLHPRRNFRLDSQLSADSIFSLTREASLPLLQQCYFKHWPLGHYCEDILNSAIPILFQDEVEEEKTDPTYQSPKMSLRQKIRNDDSFSFPFFFQFGDFARSIAYRGDSMDRDDAIQNTNEEKLLNPRIPHIKKFRYSLAKEEINYLTTPLQDEQNANAADADANNNNDTTILRQPCYAGSAREAPKLLEPPYYKPQEEWVHQLQPILWSLNEHRHYRHTRTTLLYDRVVWHNKIDQAVFRGSLLGGAKIKPNVPPSNDHDETNCQGIPRCQLVYSYSNSTLVDAKLTSTHNKLPNAINGVDLIGSELSRWAMTSYKGIIILEGNDVSSGLKWAMASSSCVLMPHPPTYTSWAMEELLEPWVHYIPLNQDLHDVEEKIVWMLEHPDEAQEIARRATLWILDLLYHPDSQSDHEEINREILRRYRQHFRMEPQ